MRSGLCWPVAVFGVRGDRWTASDGSALEAEPGDALERAGKLDGPGPVGGQAEPCSSSAAGDDAGGVEQAITQSLGFGSGKVAVESHQSRPGEKVVSNEGHGHPGGVD